ncbi:DHH family phosphoesterase [Mucisphaera calidilacus]|uniref:NanoRNase/pAp phosphatase n=1 Tax=Mucisphaera calidilacus TaxID=2527982 RepID=A0A518BV23_9BACT|nr:DHH family phosphoesterase [Mucisphaera calidilacus]QDU70816.1 NanoRNase/pAp phosphatase [Mucisphaera calidilacus]
MPDTADGRPQLTDYTSTHDAAQAADWLRAAPEPVRVITHAKPDGDAFGSVVAVVATLRALGKDAIGYVLPPVPAGITHLPGQDLVHTVTEADALKQPGSTVIVDTGAWSQVSRLADALDDNLDNTLLIDHHLSGNIPAKHRHIDPNAAACCEILWPILNLILTDAGLPVPIPVRDGLFAGITSDTGWFRFSNARPETLRAAADLLELGVDHAALYGALDQSERPEKLALLRRAIDSLELLNNASVALMSLARDDFKAAGGREEETERFVDLPQIVQTVQVVALVCETLDGKGCKISFRSKPGPHAVNVAELAASLGGGGHARAAGAKVTTPFPELLSDVRQRLMSL